MSKTAAGAPGPKRAPSLQQPDVSTRRLRDTPGMRRRYFLLGAAGLALSACRKKSPPLPLLEVPDAATPPAGGAWRELSFDPAPDIPEGERALLLVPDAPSTAPILVALHG